MVVQFELILDLQVPKANDKLRFDNSVMGWTFTLSDNGSFD